MVIVIYIYDEPHVPHYYMVEYAQYNNNNTIYFCKKCAILGVLILSRIMCDTRYRASQCLASLYLYCNFLKFNRIWQWL